MAVNGEIYNYRALRRELRSAYAFTSESDSEVLLHGYQAWGIDGLLRKVEGMYAGCILDLRLRRAVLFRDRVGIKPLYYGVLGSGVAWASELGALETIAGPNELRVDATALYDFCTYLYVPAPKTMYRQVWKLEPATYACIDMDTAAIETVKYWELDTNEARVSEADAATELRRLIGESVETQLMSDVPVGCFLSGGIDSSIVVSEAARRHQGIRTFSIGFDVQEHSETIYAEQVASACGTDHTTELLTWEDAAEMVVQMRVWFAEPFADTSALPTYLVASAARRGVSVVLTGDGGDEIFGGYKWYAGFRNVNRRWAWANRIRRLLGNPPPIALVRRGFHRMQRYVAADDLALYALMLGGLIREEKHRLRSAWNIPSEYDDYWHFRRFWRPELTQLTRLQYLDFHTYLPDDILTKVDRTSMAVSLEARVPLLATELVEFCFSLPERVRCAGGVPKGLAKAAYRNILPEGIADRAKKGFSIPVAGWRAVIGARSRSLQENLLALQFEAEMSGAAG